MRRSYPRDLTAIVRHRSGTLPAEEVRHVDAKSRKKRRSEDLARLEDLRLRVRVARKAVYLDPVGVGIRDPILPDPESSISLALANPVHARVGEHLDHQRWRSLNV